MVEMDWQPIETVPKDGAPIYLRETEFPNREGRGHWYRACPTCVDSFVLDAGGILLPVRPTQWRP